MTNLKVVILSFLLVHILFPARAVLADTGPKPTMEFTFKQEPDLLPMDISSGIMYECQQVDCSDAAPLEQLGPQGFRCDTKSCSATAYGFSPYHKLRLQFSDGKTRESNIFSTAGFESKYLVTVRADDLLVEAQSNMFPRITKVLLLCLCVMVIGLLVIGFIAFFLRRRQES